MTICNVCRTPIQTKNPSAFLCARHEHLCPPELMERYLDAVKACSRHRAMAKGYVAPTDMPEELVDAAWEAYVIARDAAIMRGAR